MSYQRSDEDPFLDRDDISFALSPEEAALAKTILTKLVGNAVEADLPAKSARRKKTAVELAKSVHLARKRRAEHFGPVLFNEPAWDMLLILFIYGDREEERLSVSRLAEFGEAPLTTAIRWLDYLESQRMIVRRQCHNDRRKYFVELSERGRAMMTAYFESLLEPVGEGPLGG